MAASFAAIKARECGADVLLVDKGFHGRNGCAAVASGAYRSWWPGETMENELKGKGDLINQKMTVKAAPETYEMLKLMEKWGVPFVRKEGGELVKFQSPSEAHGFDVGLLGGGPAMMMAIRGEVLRQGVRVQNRVMVIDLLTSDGKLPTQGQVIGALGVCTRTAEIYVFNAKSVIICAGGYSFPYSRMGTPFPGMPLDLSGDGVAMAFRAGAVMGNLAMGGFYLHPTEFLTAPGLEHFSAAGAKWVNRYEENIMEKYSSTEKQFLRRHSISAAMSMEGKEGRGPIYLDCRHFTADQFRILWSVLPIIMSNYARAGYDLSKDLVPYTQVVAGVHGFNWNAGAAINEQCATSIPGLYAAGSSSDGMHMKLSLALEHCAVLGWWAGEHAAKYAQQADFSSVVLSQAEFLAQRILEPLNARDGIDYNEIHSMLEEVFLKLGTILNVSKLETGIAEVEAIQSDTIPRLGAKDPHDLTKVLGIKNVTQLAPVIFKHLLHRKESRGAIINEDYPETDNTRWLVWTRSKLREDNEVELWDEEIPEEAFVVRKPKREKKLHAMFELMREVRK